MIIKKKTIWPLQIIICFFFIIFAALCYGADKDNSASVNSKQKIVPSRDLQD